MDYLMYTVDRRIKGVIARHLQHHQSLEAIDLGFAKGLRDELSTLTSYLESQRSRVMIFQVIDLLLESLLIIKKCLIDFTMRSSIFVMDLGKPSSFTPESAHPNRTPGVAQLRSPL